MTPDEYGWAGDKCQRDRMVSLNVGGSTFIVNARAATTWRQFLTRYDHEVEPIRLDGWDGGYACRAIRGSSAPSVHSWGLAVDINASRHPLGSAGTFSAHQMTALRHLLSAFPEIRWGGDFHTRKDEQHFEIIKDPAVCKTLAAKRAQAAPPRPRPFPLPKGHWFGPESPDPRNHSGLNHPDSEAIVRIRHRLTAGDSIRYDSKLAGKVREFQKAHKLAVDGLVGAQTWAALRIT